MPRRTLLMMARWLATVVFSLAAASAALAGSGLAVTPHTHASGTPSYHDHLLVAYRYPLFLLRLKMLAHPESGPVWSVGGEAVAGGASLGFALLLYAATRLPRPRRRPVAQLAAIGIARSQWRPTGIHGPPRATLLVPV